MCVGADVISAALESQHVARNTLCCCLIRHSKQAVCGCPSVNIIYSGLAGGQHWRDNDRQQHRQRICSEMLGFGSSECGEGGSPPVLIGGHQQGYPLIAQYHPRFSDPGRLFHAYYRSPPRHAVYSNNAILRRERDFGIAALSRVGRGRYYLQPY